jgi:hypothetical protein
MLNDFTRFLPKAWISSEEILGIYGNREISASHGLRRQGQESVML